MAVMCSRAGCKVTAQDLYFKEEGEEKKGAKKATETIGRQSEVQGPVQNPVHPWS